MALLETKINSVSHGHTEMNYTRISNLASVDEYVKFSILLRLCSISPERASKYAHGRYELYHLQCRSSLNLTPFKQAIGLGSVHLLVNHEEHQSSHRVEQWHNFRVFSGFFRFVAAPSAKNQLLGSAISKKVEIQRWA